MSNEPRNLMDVKYPAKIPINRVPCQGDFPYYKDWSDKYESSRSADPANAMQRYGPIA